MNDHAFQATHIIVAVRDTAMDKFSPAAAMPSSAFAIRAFDTEVNRADGKDNVHSHPEDFELWQLATWDESTGIYGQSKETIRMLARAKDLQRPKGSN